MQPVSESILFCRALALVPKCTPALAPFCVSIVSRYSNVADCCSCGAVAVTTVIDCLAAFCKARYDSQLWNCLGTWSSGGHLPRQCQGTTIRSFHRRLAWDWDDRDWYAALLASGRVASEARKRGWGLAYRSGLPRLARRENFRMKWTPIEATTRSSLCSETRSPRRACSWHCLLQILQGSDGSHPSSWSTIPSTLPCRPMRRCSCPSARRYRHGPQGINSSFTFTAYSLSLSLSRTWPAARCPRISPSAPRRLPTACTSCPLIQPCSATVSAKLCARELFCGMPWAKATDT